MEPQFDSVQEVSRFKALKAFDVVKEPVLVENGGFSVKALNGFPSVYTKYILKTLEADGILKLMDGVKERTVILWAFECLRYYPKICEVVCG